ncbi:MAG: hypothetical protein QOD07_135 [Frankiaceae bacterium]|jgi:hypothetical protein|nr:hypothetical protein [Frankiaceae bacterium]
MQPRDAVPALAGLLSADAIRATARTIAAAQEPSGAIPWFPGGHTDPWDHVECAMALAAAGLRDEAVRAYEWLARTQSADGSWPSKVVAGEVADTHREPHQCAYVAVGVWHHVLVTGDTSFAARLWPAVRRAVDFVVGLQDDRGTIPWAVNPEGGYADGALLTGSSSTYQSLRCGLALADLLGEEQPEWELAACELLHALTAHRDEFLDKSRFSMDWYYPVLGGWLTGAAARAELGAKWAEFVVPGLGARCVSDQPWVTGAESSELVLALDNAGRRDQALALLTDIQHLREPDGSYWTGWQFAHQVFWPDEHSTWTAAAVILAADALSRTTPANGIFRGDGLPAVTEIPGPACGCRSAVRSTQNRST